MNRFKVLLNYVSCALAAIYLLSLGALALRLALSGPLPPLLDVGWLSTSAGMWALYATAVVAMVLALYFLLRLWASMARQQRFSRKTSQGYIQLSPFAVEDFIQEALIQEASHLLDNRILLSHAPGEAVDITVTATFEHDASVVELGEWLQRLLKRQVEERLGIPVRHITIHARRMGRAAASAVDRRRSGLNYVETHETEGDA